MWTATHAVLLLLLLQLAVALLVAARKKPPSLPRGSRLLLQFNQVEACPETASQNATVVLRMLRTGDVLLDTYYSVVVPAQTISKVHMVGTSCREDGSDCEHFMHWDAPMDGCAFVAAKKAIWTPSFANTRAPFVCPVAATRYTNLNWTVDKELLSLLPIPRNRLYKGRMEMRNEGGELFWCFVFHSKFSMYKPRT